MNEVDIAGAKSTQGVFDGRFVGRNALEGTWKGSSHGSSLPFAVSTVGIGDGPFDMVHDERSYDAQSHGSAQITFTYPVMRSDSAETDSAFNENIYSAVVGMYENGVNSVAPTSVHQAMNDFIHSFRAQIGQPNSFAYYPPWSYSITGQVLFNADGIVSIRYESFSFEGGAHPNTVYTNESYDRSSGSVIRLDDLLKPGTRQQLNAIGLKAFRREHGIAPGQTLQQAGYFVSDQNFSLDSNFLVTRAGLLFQFNQYQIAPYSFGAQQVLVPYAEIRPLLLATSPISSMAFAAQGATP